MAHQSLYRTYRPQRFEDVVGQEHIVRTLRNAVAEDSIAHAYLFTGPHGTGKTTTARLLAKALDCERGPTPEPDTTCQSCVEIAEGRHPDVHELDAASRTGVEAVREEIITKVEYAPTRGPYKIYIIDEVHMLSTSAFNALLKTLEEPPGNTVFVLCTTHPHKVPDTIHSRCQRFDFHRIRLEDIVGQLERIAREEEVSVEPGTLPLIARYSEGGMRDAIATLEQLSVYTGGDIGLQDVEGLLGEIDTELLFEAADMVADRDIAGAFRFVARRADLGTDMAEFSRGLVGHFRDLYVTAATEDARGVVDMEAEHLSRLREQASRFGPDRLLRCLDLLSELLVEVRWSTDPRLALEVTLTRMASPRGERDLDALAERVEALERGESSRPASTPAPPPEPATASEPAPAAEDVPADEPTPSASEGPGSAAGPDATRGDVLDRAALKRSWQQVLAEVKKRQASKAHLFINSEVDVDGDAVVVEFPADQRVTMNLASKQETHEMLVEAVASVLGRRVPVRFQLGRGAVRPPEDEDVYEPGDVGPVVQDGDEDTGAAAERAAAEPTGGAERAAERPKGTEGPTDAAEMLIEGLGAELVAEHVDEKEGEER